MDKAHWTEVRGNVFLTKPTPDMALDTVEIPLRNSMLKGESVPQRRTITVQFDIDFVLAYIRKALIEPMNIQSESELEWLLTLVKDAYDAKQKSD